jgi:hypothetical protein
MRRRPKNVSVTRAKLTSREKAIRVVSDIQIINRNAKRLNAEARDVLRYRRVP